MEEYQMLAFTNVASKSFIKSYFTEEDQNRRLLLSWSCLGRMVRAWACFVPCGSTVTESTLNLIILLDGSGVLSEDFSDQFLKYFLDSSRRHYFLGFPEISLTILRYNFWFFLSLPILYILNGK